MRLKYSRRFIKQRNKCPDYISNALPFRLRLFLQDRKSFLLHDHALTGSLQGMRSINITGDWRALYVEIDKGEIVIFVAIGTHSQLYT